MSEIRKGYIFIISASRKVLLTYTILWCVQFYLPEVLKLIRYIAFINPLNKIMIKCAFYIGITPGTTISRTNTEVL